MRTKIKKWGNSAAVRIPSSVLMAARLGLDEAVDVREEAGRIVIEPVCRKVYELEELLKGINSKDRHEPADFGAAAGIEVQSWHTTHTAKCPPAKCAKRHEQGSAWRRR